MKNTLLKATFLCLLGLTTQFTKAEKPCLDGWKYRVAVYVNNESGGVLSAHQAHFIANTQDLVVAGKAKADAGDMRITDKAGNPLHHWIKNNSYNTPSTTFWVNISSIPAAEVDTIYLFYGNADAAAEASGTSTFELFDDFKSATLDDDLWEKCTPGGVVTVSGGTVNLASSDNITTASITTKATYSVPVWIEARINSVDEGQTLIGLHDASKDGYAMVYENLPGNNRDVRLGMIAGDGTSGTCLAITNQSPANNVAAGATAGIWSFAWPVSSKQKMIWPGGNETRTESAVTSFGNPKHAFIANMANSGQVNIDYVYVRKHTENQPILSLDDEVQLIDGLVASNGGPYCEGETVELFSPTYVGATYTWSGPGIGTGNKNLQNPTATEATPEGMAGTYAVTVAITGGCAAQTVYTEVVVYPTTESGTLSGAATVCETNNDGQLEITSFVGDIQQWQMSNSLGGPWSTINQTSTTLNFYDIANTTHYRTIVKSGTCVADTTIPATILVDKASKGGDVLGVDEGCEGDNSGELTLANYFGAIQRWQYSDNEGVTWVDIANTTNVQQYTDLVSTRYFRAITKSGVCSRDTSAISILSIYPKPDVDFTFSTACFGHNTKFTNTTSSETQAFYSWDFDDGTGASVPNPQHIFPETRTFNVKLTVTTAEGCIDSVRIPTPVTAMPVADFTYTEECAYDIVSFFDQSTLSAGLISQYHWEFGAEDASSDVKFGQYRYMEFGEYDVKLVVSSNGGCKDSITQVIRVKYQPTATFTVEDVCDGLEVEYKNTTVEEQFGVSYSWYYGDGNFSNDRNPKHTYANAGTYNITFHTTSNEGCRDEVHESVTVNPLPEPSFISQDTCIYDSIQLVNTSSIQTGTMQYNWDLGDGTITAVSNPVHLYAAMKTYLVQLVATSDKNCVSKLEKEISLYPKPSADFSSTKVCLEDSTIFTNRSNIEVGSISYKWTFTEGNTSSAQDPLFLFSTDGTFNVSLEVISEENCKDTLYKEVVVHPLPETDFEGITVCDGDSMSFVNKTNINLGTTQEYTWYFGDQQVATEGNPKHLYLNAGEYFPRLVAISDKNCVYDTTIAVTVIPFPIAKFTIENACNEMPAVTTNLSSVEDGTLAYTWYFTDEDTSNLTSPAHIFSNVGIFTVKLISQSEFGCVDSSEKSVEVYSISAVDAGKDTSVSLGFEVPISVNVNEASAYNWTPANTVNNSHIKNPLARPLETTIYSVEVIDGNGCSSFDSVKVEVIQDHKILIHNLITPDGNGINDVWNIINADAYDGVMDVSVFDRYGKEIYHLEGYDPSWGGVSGTDELPDGTYYYVITFQDSEEVYKGALTVLRNR